MDTKSKKYENRIVVKTVCVLLSLLFVIGSAAFTILAVGTVIFCGSFDCFDSKWELEQTGVYNEAVKNYVIKIQTIAMLPGAENTKDLIAQRDDAVKEKLNEYLDSKAEFIERSLKELYRDGTIIEGVDIGGILNSAEGRDFLKYEDYVTLGNDIFEFKYDFSKDTFVNYFYNNELDYYLSENEARELLTESYNDAVREYLGTDNIQYNVDQLNKLDNFHYYIKTEAGLEYTNMTDASSEIKNLAKNKVYFSYRNGKINQRGLDYCMKGKERSSFRENVGIDTLIGQVPANTQVSFYISDTITSGDVFYRLSKGQELFGAGHTLLYVVFALILFVCAIISIVALLSLSGRTSDTATKIFWVDRIPTDIHFILSLAFSGGFIALAAFLCIYGLGGLDVSIDEAIIKDFLYSRLVVAGSALLCGLAWLVFIEWITSTSRLKKAGKSFFRRFLGVQFLCLIGRIIKRIFSILFYKPKKFKRNVVLICIGVCLIDLFLIAMTIAVFDDAVTLVFIALFLVFNTLIIIKLLNYVETLDEVICASHERRAPNVNANTLPVSLKSLVSSMSVTQGELDRAINTAVRDERMKTELITNVSHDLKTPLTSIISYVDLLKRCNIQDETAQNYLSVLEEKSSRLKTLVEDLVEASKASSGNVSLNCTGLNLTELVLQATGEMSGDFENVGLELVFDEPEQSPVVFADSQKTYRVIENLFNNARKYSASNSRVYVAITMDSTYGNMEIKNVSRDMLNISPDELTERFVRGDSSRTDGGSGLGLAIAKDLCELQKGVLKLEIDGDLFKATVKLPLYKGQSINQQ